MLNSSLLSNSFISSSISEFKGLSIAINASFWLLQSLHSLIEDLLDQEMKDLLFYVDSILMRVRNFRIVGVEPVMVFNGKRNIIKVPFFSILCSFFFFFIHFC